MNQIIYNCDWNNKMNIKKINRNKKNILKLNKKDRKDIYTLNKNGQKIGNDSFINFNNKNSTKTYKSIFFSSVILLSFFIVLLLIRLYESNKNAEISKKLTSSYSISTLYSNLNTNNYYTTYDENVPFVIGIIKINKINLNYSILSISNNKLLDISVCRFAGPMPNEVGNLCIAGHNYVDYKFFSRLNELEINDKINIYDLDGNNIIYEVYNIYETKPDDTSCTLQNTDGQKIVTLVTCNNVNGKRLVVQAKEIP